MSWALTTERTGEVIQTVVDQVSTTFQFCSDGHTGYKGVNYHRSLHLVAHGNGPCGPLITDLFG